MERTMSVEERIRRAEEIYNKRKENLRDENVARVNVNDGRDLRIFRKLILQIITCLFIYAVFYLIVNNNYIFSQDFRNRAKEILLYDINFQNLYQTSVEKLNSIFKKENNQNEQTTEKKENVENVEDNQNAQSTENNESTENTQENIDNIENIDNAQENIGGAEKQETNNVIETSYENLSQEEQDINYIKNNINIIKPVEGVISSRFGYREPSLERIPKNHTGLDIAANTGTKIISATDGTVILSSSQGDYRKSLTNKNK